MKRIWLLISIISINLLFSSCSLRDSIDIGNNLINSEDQGFVGDVMDKGPQRGGSLKTFSTYPDTLNPILTKNLYVKDFSMLIFESLVRMDRYQRPVPLLADKWLVSDDGLTWTFYLRKNIKWQDGSQFTADDVEFTISTLLDPKVDSVYKKNVENISACVAVSKDTVKIILKKPNSFTTELMTFPIISKKYFAGEYMAKSSKNNAPLGTGPYKFLSYDVEKNIKLTVDENWWRFSEKLESIPYINEINIKLYKNSNDLLVAFQDEEIDVAYIKNRDFSKFNGRSDIKLKKFPSNNYEFIAINTTNAILKEKSVRHALAYAINKVKLIEKIMPGEAVAADMPVIPDTWLYENNALSFNPSSQKAKEVLVENGWRDNNGIYYKSILGVPRNLELTMLVNEDNDLRTKVAEEIGVQLKEAGISLKVEKVKWEDEFKKLNSKQYDLALIGWSIPNYSDMSYAFSGELSGGFNVTGFKNETVESYLSQIQSENDDSKKESMFFNMRSIISDEVPYIGLYFYNHGVLFNKRVRGDLNSYQWNKYNDITKWYLPISED